MIINQSDTQTYNTNQSEQDNMITTKSYIFKPEQKMHMMQTDLTKLLDSANIGAHTTKQSALR